MVDDIGAGGSPAVRPFPRERVAALLRRLPTYARLAWLVARDSRLSRTRRLSVLGAAAYLVSPIDLVPGIIPVVGQLDDLLIALVALRAALAGLPPGVRVELLSSVGLTESTLDDDLRTAVDTTAWLLARAGRLVTAGSRVALGVAGTACRATVRSARRRIHHAGPR